MSLLPDLQTLHAAAAAVERIADQVDADATSADRLVEAIPWRGPRRERILSLVADGAVGTGRRQAGAERELARALRELAGEVERELHVLADLAARARRHLEDLLSRARAVAAHAAQAAAEAVRSMASVAFEMLTGDPAGAVRAAQSMVDRAEDALRSITQRLQGLPAPHDPTWHRLGVEILQWQPL